MPVSDEQTIIPERWTAVDFLNTILVEGATFRNISGRIGETKISGSRDGRKSVILDFWRSRNLYYQFSDHPLDFLPDSTVISSTILWFTQFGRHGLVIPPALVDRQIKLGSYLEDTASFCVVRINIGENRDQVRVIV